MVTLRTMSKERHDAWASNIWDVYYRELLQAGYSEAEAREQSAVDPSNSVEYGKTQPGNFVLEVVLADKAIGNVWLVQKESEWWIYDIEIDEELRGAGHGRSAMKAIEEYVRRNDGNRIRLSVFGFNESARALYESEGFETVRVQMKKDLR